MKRIIGVFLALLIIAPLAIAANTPEQVFRSLEARISHAVVTRDAKEMNKLFASDYTSVGVLGQIRSRAEIIEMYSSGRLAISNAETGKIMVRQYGDIAIVVGVVNVSGKDGDVDISGRYAFTRVYERISGEWRAVTFEATPAK